jgi:hypothetical protein
MLRLSVALSLLLALPLAAPAAEPIVVVELTGGKVMQGAVDAATSAEELVLRSGRNGVTIRRPVRWDRIARATLAGRVVEAEELQRLAPSTAGQASSGTQGSGFRVQEPGVRGQGAGIGSQEPGVSQVPELPVRLTSIAFEARIANWDGDVETDGLLIDLLPLDDEGYLAAAAGTAEIELFASQRREFQHAPLSGGDTLELVERWTRSIRPEDVTTRGVRLKLPFGAVHPEFDQKWLAHYYGLVHVRFAAPGQGVFEASQDGLRIRPYAPLRDRLELYGGRRFLPTERTGRGVSAVNNDW